MPRIKKNECKEICAQCGGACCKTFGCILAPKDIKKIGYELTVNGILLMLLDGLFALDSYCDTYNDRFIWFVRPRHKYAPAIDESYGGECVFLTPNGCLLPWSKRPTQGKMLDPHDCIERISRPGGTKIDMALLWEPYQDILCEAGRQYIAGIQKDDNDCSDEFTVPIEMNPRINATA